MKLHENVGIGEYEILREIGDCENKRFYEKIGECGIMRIVDYEK